MIDVIPLKLRIHKLFPIGLASLATACAPGSSEPPTGAQFVPISAQVSTDLERAEVNLQGVERIALTDNDRVASVAGQLGQSTDAVLAAFGEASEATLVSEKTDALGFSHRRYTQTINGLPLVGGDLRIARGPSGEVVYASGVATRSSDIATPTVRSADAHETAFAAIVGAREIEGGSLVYVAGSNLSPTLAWQFVVRGFDEANSLLVDDLVFIDAVTGQLATRHPRFYTARNRVTNDAQNQEDLGVLVRGEADPPTGDLDTDNAHDAAGDTYDCINDLLSRDSFDGNGATLTSVVHFGQNLQNAGWSAQAQVMIYGDGFADGDVGTHEFGHALTTFTADLIYMDESGAINEGASDVLMAICDIHKAGAIDSGTWEVGEDLSIGPLRWMKTPTIDGFSTDHYEERFLGPEDNGGVHLNSGIFNLYFVLLVEGGVHTRRPGQEVVAAGIEAAQQIHFRALTMYMNRSTNFAAARVATEMAATDLFGADSAELISVQEAWFAVGVGGAPAARPVCGNSAIETDESCDDGNAVDGDGCNASCITEICGDSVINNSGAETCDDGNTLDDDGCDATCEIETESTCGCTTTPSAPEGIIFLIFLGALGFSSRRRLAATKR